MYYYLKGTLAAKGENYIVVDVSGVGYMVYTSLNGIEPPTRGFSVLCSTN